ncbi:hypothetical protein LSAT2_026581 [Lamellibrachia satsuma]|nr:hypothetical protein LSAT2_026581 [Lamellibrachia satsuma]
MTRQLTSHALRMLQVPLPSLVHPHPQGRDNQRSSAVKSWDARGFRLIWRCYQRTHKPWAWRDGTNVQFLNWAEDEPEDDPEMHCAGMWTNTGEWHSNKCHRSFGYVCKVAKVLYTTAKSSEEPSATTHGHIVTSTQTTRGASGLSPSAIVGIVFGTLAGLLCIGAVVFIVVVKLNVLESVKLPTVSFHNPNYERHKDEAVEAKVDGNDSAATAAVVTSDAAVIDVK